MTLCKNNPRQPRSARFYRKMEWGGSTLPGSTWSHFQPPFRFETPRVLKLLMESASILSSNEMTPRGVQANIPMDQGLFYGYHVDIRPETGTSLWNLGRVVRKLPRSPCPDEWCHSQVANPCGFYTKHRNVDGANRWCLGTSGWPVQTSTKKPLKENYKNWVHEFHVSLSKSCHWSDQLNHT